METPPARLLVKRGPTLHREFNLLDIDTTLGRGATNSVVFADPEVSRRHARITRDLEGYTLEDLSSTNGTYVNGKRLNGRIRLHNGDELALGEVVILLFVYEQEYELYVPAAERVETAVPPRQSYNNPVEIRVPASERVLSQDNHWEDLGQPQSYNRSSRRRRAFGCGCVLFLLVVMCMAALFFLDAYQQGRLLYCGPVRPVFEAFLGPFGFTPACG